MASQESKKHHFVPKLLLRPWLVNQPAGDRQLHGYWWNPYTNSLACKTRGLDSFCCQLDLLTLRKHALGRDAIERIFFGDIDDKGAVARDALLRSGPSALSSDTRSDFARLLMSLEARRPAIISKLRTQGPITLRDALNNDPEILREFQFREINMRPSDFVEQKLGLDLEDRALANVQALTNNRVVGERLINAHWGLRAMKDISGSLILSDRPLIRFFGYDEPGATWLLPLTPHVAFIACNNGSALARLMRLSDDCFVKDLNRSSVSQAERFIFSIDPSHANWIGRHIQRKASSA